MQTIISALIRVLECNVESNKENQVNINENIIVSQAIKNKA
jgi:hypothetical protein